MDRKAALNQDEHAQHVEQELARLTAGVERWRTAIGATYLGQADVVEELVLCALSGGHALVEGVPGLGKTTLVKAFAGALDLSFARVQFTPDLMPGDVLGGRILDEDEHGRRRFRFETGPIFAHVVLADEINRAGPRTQSALLEAMAERQVTSFGETRPLPDPFLLVATQNPIEMEGTYPLPEAQLDRFMVQILVPEPNLAELSAVLAATTRARTGPEAAPVERVATKEDLLRWRTLARQAIAASDVVEYAARVVLATAPREGEAPPLVLRSVRHGASPRGGIALLALAKARAVSRGRLHATREDIDHVAAPCLRHRLILSYEGLAAEQGRDTLVEAALEFAASQ